MKPRLHYSEYLRLISEGGYGVCLSCGEVENVPYVEPDAEGLTCTGCCAPQVMGLENALVAEEIEIEED